MNRTNDVEGIYTKIEEMRSFFKIGDEIIPFLMDMFEFIKDMTPLLSEVNTSLEETTQKLPTASDRISSASQTTELAAHEILNNLDSISGKLKILEKSLDNDDRQIMRDIQK